MAPTDDPDSPIVAPTQWWAPGRADWQVSAAFAVGSACFAVGAIPVYAAAVGAVADGVTYFVGSLFFTTAALLQVLLSAGIIRAAERPRASVPWRQRVRSPNRPERWAGVVQLVGTLMFNISTFEALQQGLDATQAQRRVWTLTPAVLSPS